MSKTLAFLTVALFSLLVTEAKAEFQIWAPINPQFMGGNPANGPFLLQKALVTNEHKDDIVEKIQLMTHRLIKQLDEMLDKVLDHIDEIKLDFDFNMPIVIQVGDGNSAVITSQGGGLSSGKSFGMLSDFNPSWGME